MGALWRQLATSASCCHKWIQISADGQSAVPELIERMKCGDTERRERVVPMQIIIAMLGAAKVTDSASLAQQALENDIVGATMRILTLAPQAEPQPEPEPC